MKFRNAIFLLPLSALIFAGTAPAALPTDVFDDPLLSSQWQWKSPGETASQGIRIADAWAAGITGEGVVIGILGRDWISQTHEDLNISAYNPSTDWTTADLSQGLSYDFATPGNAADLSDYLSTGTDHEMSAAGMAAAVGGNGKGVVGAAPGATLAAVHGVDKESFLWGSGLSSSGKYVGDAQIQVKNFYIGGFFSQYSTQRLESLRLSAANNVVYTCSAFNSRGASDHQYGFPSNTGWLVEGNSRYAINVAAYGTDGYYSQYSDYGANVFVTAPGEALPTTSRYGYTDVGGTSFSAPLVAGVVALGKQICPDMDARWAKHALAWSSGHGETPNIDPDGAFHYSWENSTGFWQKNNGGYWFNNNYGFGRVDAVGFVDAVRDVLYTTTETLFAQTADGFSRTLADASAGTSCALEYAVNVGAGTLSRNIETVSVSVKFSAWAADLNLTTLKVELVAPDGARSILVQGSVGDPERKQWDGYTAIEGYTFLTNAFWGSDYKNAEGDWKVNIEYETPEGGQYVTDWVALESVEWSMGEVVFEGEGRAVAAGQNVNVHAVALDSGDFSVAGTLRLEDSVTVSAGKFTLEKTGALLAYEDGVFGADKGAKFLQNGGEAELRGNAVFKRGMTLEGGALLLAGTAETPLLRAEGGGAVVVFGEGALVSGGNVEIAEDARAVFSGTLVVSEGGVSFAEGAKFLLDLTDLGAFGAGVARLAETASASDAALAIVTAEALKFGDVDASLLDSVAIDAFFDADASELGEFENTLRFWSYDGNTLSLRFSPIPEPSAFGLLAGTLALALAGTRRRRRKA